MGVPPLPAEGAALELLSLAGPSCSRAWPPLAGPSCSLPVDSALLPDGHTLCVGDVVWGRSAEYS